MKRYLSQVQWMVLGFVAAAGCGPTNLSGPTGVVVSTRPNAAVPVTVAVDNGPVVAIPDPQPTEPVVQPAAAVAAVQGPVAQAGSDAPKPPVKQRLPADRQPRRPGDAEKITFEDLNLGMQADVVFRPFMITERVKELEGQRISILGYIHGGQPSQTFKEFYLLKNNQCKFGPGGQADHLGRIYLKEGKTTHFTADAVKVEGTLVVAPFNGPDGNTWSVYDIKDAEVVK